MIYKNLKLVIIVISSIIISFIFFFNKAFYQKENHSEWRELNSDDFKGIVKPFSKFDATIYYDIIVTFDSINKRFISKAIQKREHSWMRDSAKDNEDLLKHEQYHFNISEYNARILNQYLIKTNPKTKADFKFKLVQIIEKNNQMQSLYDLETDHGTIEKKQNQWENKIDSFLKKESNNRKYTYNLLKERNYTIKWVEMTIKDTLAGKIELYISDKKDTLWNQFLFTKKEKIDTLNSFFYDLKIEKLLKENYHKGKIKLFLNTDNLKTKNHLFTYLEQNRDSVWLTSKKINPMNEIKFNFCNYYSNKIHGIISWLNIENKSLNYILIDNKSIVSDTFINLFEIDSIRRIHKE